MIPSTIQIQGFGELHIVGDRDTGWFAQGHLPAGDGTFFSIQMSEDGQLMAGVGFVMEQLSKLPALQQQALEHLAVHFPTEASSGEGPLASEPELTFWEQERWSILFAEGRLTICHPYGVLVDFNGTTPVGYQDLSGAEEI
ncbi:hypothetical protein E5C33_06525 [Stenotrophomonas maltophilia]|uniref:hypothetical protein n=1 Tax=Stenotrophomonas maltophilia TaxID=40324 RepID=UPI001075E8A3|nr:hypothetical protein [Stenotrophomonas maltophilia]TFZ46248.1 hypothetical protein E5C33_06525 [Stenotrophomonas maltophilia]